MVIFDDGCDDVMMVTYNRLLVIMVLVMTFLFSAKIGPVKVTSSGVISGDGHLG